MYGNILLPVDLTKDGSSDQALARAVEHCRAFGAKLTLLSVVPDFGMTVVGDFFPEDYEAQTMAKAEAELAKLAADAVPAEIDAATGVAFGTVYEEILRAAERIGADLIVMGSHRPELKDYLLGSNAANVVRHARCSVLVVRD